MGTSERTNSGVGRQRGIVYGLLFTAVAWVGLLAFGNTAYAADSTSGDTANASSGTATGASGDATATGNSTGTGASQSGSGGSGGLSVSNQKVKVKNEGTATANTGGNDAVGNNSVNTADNNQDVNSDGSADVQSNSGGTSNRSNGSASITTGNATATGNSSWTEVRQGDPSGGLAFVDQTAVITNDGDASASTGNNDAIGNNSLNTATNDQTIRGSDNGTILANQGDVTNESDGHAGVTTGDANSTGSQSHDNVAQWATIAGGSSSGIFDVNQSARVNNDGDADADTGRNTATGNNSDNLASNDQDVRTARGPPQRADVVLSNSGDTSNSSDGSASIDTGSADALGVSSTTQITQNVDGVNDGLHFVDQRARVNNDGEADADSGRNDAIGNNSLNTAVNDQDARIRESGKGDLKFRGRVVLSNVGDTSNNSDGSASIVTGDAMATGVDSSHTTTISQAANAAAGDNGIATVDQRARVNNIGDASGNSGRNTATGNNSFNVADNSQDAQIRESDGGDLNLRDVVLSNISDASNNSDGSASITTGSAHGLGINATTSISQTSDVAFGGKGFATFDQSARVNNNGTADGDSGRNDALGNNSFNVATNDQDTRIRESGGGDLTARDVVGSNIADTSNNSDGSASITTGTACACNTASTTVAQNANFANGDDGFATFDQNARVNNIGVGTADSGRNDALGNNSFNVADNNQDPTIRESDGGDLDVRGAVLSNIGSTTNDSDGSASISTGSAQGTGITSTTSIGQDANFANGDKGFATFDQRARVNNEGDGTANTGRNDALGNNSFNVVDNNQDTRIRESGGGDLDARDVVLSNMNDVSNSSDGSASIATGDATAYGSYGNTDVAQSAGFANSDAGFALLDQRARVNNDGDADANSGRNSALGNNSFNVSTNDQNANIRERDGGDLTVRDTVQSNIADTTNSSDGSASISTGDATAYGNATNTKLGEAADLALTDKGFAIVDQNGRVRNEGDATANTGRNDVTGNNSLNIVDNSQDARIRESGGGDLDVRDAVLSNIASTGNDSDGTATLETGNAYALGNYSATNMQLAAATGDSPLTLADQRLRIDNIGNADANSGKNDLTANNSINDSTNDQDTPITQSGGGSLDVRDVVSSNIATTENRSDGTATARTGNAIAIGNVSVQSACSGLNTAVDCPEVSLPPLPPPSCPCKKATPPPVVPPTTTTVTPPGVPGEVGEQLPVTGGPLGVQVALGLMLVALGSLLRRRSKTAG
ncbi:MAG: hypothetical protein QOE35_21 [Actinomycetota bacterium]|jgi:hypothetical protein